MKAVQHAPRIAEVVHLEILAEAVEVEEVAAVNLNGSVMIGEDVLMVYKQGFVKIRKNVTGILIFLQQ